MGDLTLGYYFTGWGGWLSDGGNPRGCMRADHRRHPSDGPPVVTEIARHHTADLDADYRAAVADIIRHATSQPDDWDPPAVLVDALLDEPSGYSWPVRDGCAVIYTDRVLELAGTHAGLGQQSLFQ